MMDRVALIVAIVAIASRIYTGSLLRMGGRVSVKEALRRAGMVDENVLLDMDSAVVDG